MDHVAPSSGSHRLSRRRALALGLGVSAGLLMSGCDVARRVAPGSLLGDDASSGRLTARPSVVPARPPEAWLVSGRQAIPVQRGRRAFLDVPKGLDPSVPAPFALGLHGASGRAEAGLRVFGSFAEAEGVIQLAPEANQGAWDVMLGGFGEDVAFIDRALGWVFARYAIDPAHLGCTGFSNGASYTLSLGPTNGDLFTHLAAFSPGFMAPSDPGGRPEVFIAHGTQDKALPIDRTSRRIVPELRAAGYDVIYREFEGKHEILPRLSRRALEWFLR
jgi:phospholipase/carboxylesterase